ncbi:hypothetical protein F0562_005220 [Nyssa sinensis]|uniref:Ribosomal RNA-processing protein 7 C-terminal domain-containing protein n=1 Tax=Nyssa sinensis TaxID=561372 RepID=A0A5J5AN57_9ASTE|nr:hypothetical protein F0562_005220 [Nyssa sinensis]
MGTEDSQKNLKITAKPLALKKKKNSKEYPNKNNAKLVEVGMSKKTHKTKKKDRLSPKEHEKLLEKKGEAAHDESIPGLKLLQERIDDFITAYEAQEEQIRKEREARATEGGWTVVVHHKGRTKTTDSESGITMGSVAPSSVLDKMAKKKSKEVGLDFYQFQKRVAQRNDELKGDVPSELKMMTTIGDSRRQRRRSDDREDELSEGLTR